MHHRNTVRDLLLVFSASCVLTLAMWPLGESRQVLQIETSAGHWETRSMALSDPIVQGIETQLVQRKLPSLSPDVAVANWKQELSSFYQKNPAGDPSEEAGTTAGTNPAAATASISDEVMIASYQSGDSSVESSAVNEAAMWSDSPAATPLSALPVRMGEIKEPTRPQFAFHVAFLVGVLMACVYKHWAARVPRIAKRKQQPIAVRVRQYSLASLASLAGFAALLLVI